MAAAWIVVVLVALSRLYLAADYPSNVAYAALFSWVADRDAVPMVRARRLLPGELPARRATPHTSISAARGPRR